MSNILDALRKAQSEQKITKGQSLSDSASLIVHRTTSQHAHSSRTLIIICCGLLLLSVTGWFLYGPSKNNASDTPVVAKTITPVPAAPPVLPQQQAPLQQPLQVSSGNQNENPPDNRNKARQDQKDQSGITNVPAVQSEVPLPASVTVPVTSATPEGVKLTGIAWQDSRKMRRAVINDILVGEGAVVAGAKVLEIKPDMVRFEKNGSLFEAMLPR